MSRGDPLAYVGSVHGRLVHGRRIERLAALIDPLLGPRWSVVDVGCGDGTLGARLLERRPDLDLSGLELAVREGTRIPVGAFDGERLPLPDRSVDAALFVDVLHHTDDPKVLLAEAARVARHAVVLKDHRTARLLAVPTLRAMDWVGNRPHGVRLPYNYWSEDRWIRAWSELGLVVEHFLTDLALYPRGTRWLFERGLHFVARLAPTSASDG